MLFKSVFGKNRPRSPKGNFWKSFFKGTYRSGFYLELQVWVHFGIGQGQDNGAVGIGGHLVLVVDELQPLVGISDVQGQVKAVPLEHKACGIDVSLGRDVFSLAESGLGKVFKAL